MPAIPDFDAQVEGHRRELLAACYQMLGSVHDAEDVVQETMVRAWRARDRFDPERASLRTWLHRIATNASLTALEGRGRRPLPSMVVEAGTDVEQPLVPSFEVPWLQPIPTALLVGDPGRSGDPLQAVVERGQLRLAFTAALQLLTPRQRAVLILRDVLRFSAAEVAVMLDVSVPAANSLLQRARRTLADRPIHAGVSSAARPVVPDADPAATRAVVERFTDAFVRGDVAGLAALLVEDAVLEMPPVPRWYVGRDRYAAFMEVVYRRRGRDWRVVPAAANGQPAFGAYVLVDGVFRLHTLQVLDVVGERVAANVVFQDPAVLATFGFAATLEEEVVDGSVTG